MKSSDRQLSEILIRSDRIKTGHKIRMRAWTDAAASFACILLIAAAAFQIPRISEWAVLPYSRYGSLILKESHIGYVVIGILAFVLGVFITLLGLHIREYRSIGERKNE